MWGVRFVGRTHSHCVVSVCSVFDRMLEGGGLAMLG